MLKYSQHYLGKSNVDVMMAAASDSGTYFPNLGERNSGIL